MIRTSDPSGPFHFPVPCPQLLGLRHPLPCCKDFWWVFIGTTSTSNTVLAYNKISYGARAEIQTRVRWELSNRSTIWAINCWLTYIYSDVNINCVSLITSKANERHELTIILLINCKSYNETYSILTKKRLPISFFTRNMLAVLCFGFLCNIYTSVYLKWISPNQLIKLIPQ